MTSIWDRIFPTSAHKKQRELTPEEEVREAARREIDERAAGGSPAPEVAPERNGPLYSTLLQSFGGPAIPQALTTPVNSQVVPQAQPQAPAPARPAPVQPVPVQAPEPQPQALQPSPEVQADPSQPPPGTTNDVGLIGRLLGYGDQTPDARGLTAADRSQMGFNSLAQMGAMLAAAGQPMAPGQRAQILASMGHIGPNAQMQAEQIGTNRAYQQYQTNRAQAALELARAKAAGKGDGGPFAGTSMEAQAHNILLRGDPNSPEYAAAYQYMNKPKEQFDSATGRMIVTRPDMSWARPPGGSAGHAPGTSSYDVPGMGGRYNETQGKAASFADRIRESEPYLSQFSAAAQDQYQRAVAAGGTVLSNHLNSDAYKRYEQAERNYINAVLRRESGAVISDQEFANARRQYMPQPGDSPELLQQKAQNRQTVLSGMAREAGPSYKPTEIKPTQATPQPQTTQPPPRGATPTPQGTNRADLEAEMRRRGLIK